MVASPLFAVNTKMLTSPTGFDAAFAIHYNDISAPLLEMGAVLNGSG